MLSVLLILHIVVVLHLQPTDGAGVSVGRDCEIEAHFTSPYINAYFERLALVTGCVSTETSSKSQEVHVISLIGGVHHPSKDSEVTLHIRPHANTGIHRGPLVFVLNSHYPVKWIIQAERISNQTKNKFFISKISRLDSHPSNIRVKKSSLPLDTDGLAAWTRHQFKAITSFVEVEQANTFLKKVGTDESAPATCNITANFFDRISTAAYLQPQPMAGCAAIGNENTGGSTGRDVHVIELESGNMNPHNQQEADILLDIKAKSRSSHSNNKHIALILKSHNPLRWHIRTSRGVRNLEIMTDRPADMVETQDPMPQSVAMTIDNFGNHKGEDLIRRVQEGYGPIVSYTNMRLANRIDLYFDGANDYRQQASSRAWEDKNNLVPPKSPFDNPSWTRNILNRAKKVVCNETGMTVLLEKSELRFVRIRQEHLSLKNTSCVATANQTHYILKSSFGDCMTEGSLTQPISNAILVNHIDESHLELEDEGSALNADMASGFFLDETHIDDEDYSNMATANSPISVPVNCLLNPEYPEGMQPEQTLSYHLDSYLDLDLNSKIDHFPHQLNGKDTIYVKAKLDAANLDSDFRHGLEARVHTCWFSESSVPEAGNAVEILIQNGCANNGGIQWLEADASFSMKLSPKMRSLGKGYLHCKLIPCGPADTKLPQCQSQVEFCRRHPKTDFQFTKTQSIGPFAFLTSYEATAQPVSDQHNHEQKCQQVMTVEGLDSATVVGIAFAAFIIGVLLTAALWFIHTHTGPMRKQNRPRSTETSGESTPSSTAPITIHQIHT